MTKYGAHAVEVDGIRFASKAEARRYGELKLLERGKAISNLECHPVYRMTVNGKFVGKYTGDFRYTDEGMEICEDVKSPATAKGEAYRLRIKLARACYPDVEFVEVVK